MKATDERANGGRPAKRRMNVFVFAAMWFITCTATAIAAVELPIDRLVRGWGGSPKRGNEMHLGSQQNIEQDQTKTTYLKSYRSITIREMTNPYPSVDDGTVCVRPQWRAPAEILNDALLAPIEALCSFLITRNTDDLFEVVHPKLSEYLYDQFGIVLNLLDGSDELFARLVGWIFDDGETVVSGVSSVDYSVISTKQCGSEELKRIEDDAKQWYDGLEVTRACVVGLELRMSTDTGEYTTRYSPIIYKTVEGWYIDVGDVNFTG